MQLIEQVASDEVIEQAFLWICLKRKEHSHNNDVWNLRRHWQTVKPDLQKQLLDGTYRFSPQQEIRLDTETIELKMAEQILNERPPIEKLNWLIKLISIVAPLMGLFGTIIGMIITFQMITLFGTGDPKTMAEGISIALVTTWLGLAVAIPMTFMSAIVSNFSKGILETIEEQAIGMAAERSEK